MKTIAELVDDLFRSHRKDNGREYTYKEISSALDGAIDPSHISKLRYGLIKNPNRSTLLALCRFFRVPASYFFPELQDIEDESKQNTLPRAQAAEEIPMGVVLRSTHISPAVRKKLELLIQALEAEEEEDRNDTSAAQ